MTASFDMSAMLIPETNTGFREQSAKQKIQGQAGPKLNLGWDRLSTNEKRVLKVMLPAPGEHRKPMSIADIVTETGWAKREGKAKANSWVRNQMRRLVRAGYVEHPEMISDGKYVLTDYGKRQCRMNMDSRPTPQDLPTPSF